MARFCARDDQPVRESKEGERIIGRPIPRGKYVHTASSAQGVPGCGRPFLEESETYTEGESGYERTSEPQY